MLGLARAPRRPSVRKTAERRGKSRQTPVAVLSICCVLQVQYSDGLMLMLWQACSAQLSPSLAGMVHLVGELKPLVCEGSLGGNKCRSKERASKSSVHQRARHTSNTSKFWRENGVNKKGPIAGTFFFMRAGVWRGAHNTPPRRSEALAPHHTPQHREHESRKGNPNMATMAAGDDGKC